MVRTLTVRPDYLCCHKWSGRTTCACITGPPGPTMPDHKWSGLNINGLVPHTDIRVAQHTYHQLAMASDLFYMSQGSYICSPGEIFPSALPYTQLYSRLYHSYCMTILHTYIDYPYALHALHLCSFSELAAYIASYSCMFWLNLMARLFHYSCYPCSNKMSPLLHSCICSSLFHMSPSIMNCICSIGILQSNISLKVLASCKIAKQLSLDFKENHCNMEVAISISVLHLAILYRILQLFIGNIQKPIQQQQQ